MSEIQFLKQTQPQLIKNIPQLSSDTRPRQLSFYITPWGNIINCRHPYNLGHIDMSKKIYGCIKDLENTPEPDNPNIYPYKKSIAFTQDQEEFSFSNITNLLLSALPFDVNAPENKDIKNDLINHQLNDDELLCQDLGFVKLVKLSNFYEVFIPNPLFRGHTIKEAQKDTLIDIAEILGLTKDTMKSLIQSAINKTKAYSLEEIQKSMIN